MICLYILYLLTFRSKLVTMYTLYKLYINSFFLSNFRSHPKDFFENLKGFFIVFLCGAQIDGSSIQYPWFNSKSFLLATFLRVCFCPCSASARCFRILTGKRSTKLNELLWEANFWLYWFLFNYIRKWLWNKYLFNVVFLYSLSKGLRNLFLLCVICFLFSDNSIRNLPK